MRVVYEPSGRAAEYAELAVNLYRGCGHGCVYCYAPKALRMSHRDFWDNPKPRKGILKKLEKDCQELSEANETRPILLCFTCDPYQPIEMESDITQKAIDILQKYNLKYKILTKGGSRIVKDLVCMDRNLCELGASLTFADDNNSREFEPGAAVTSNRIMMLHFAKTLGFKTWVSLEPVWSAEDAIALIEGTKDFVDEYRIGKLNYHPHAKQVDWRAVRYDIVDACESMNVNYVLKNDLEVL